MVSQNGISVINNVRRGGPETWKYCFDGLPINSVLCIGSKWIKIFKDRAYDGVHDGAHDKANSKNQKSINLS